MRELMETAGRAVGSWLLWSPRRAVGAAVGILVLLAVLGTVTRARHAPVRVPVAVPAAVPSPVPVTVTVPPPVAPSSPDPVPPVEPTPVTNPPEPRPAPPTTDPGTLAVAYSFVVAWAQPQLPPARWRTGVDTNASPRLTALLAYTDPARVPAHAVRGPAVQVAVTPDGSTVATVPTDAGPVQVTLRRVSGRTVVDSIGPGR